MTQDALLPEPRIDTVSGIIHGIIVTRGGMIYAHAFLHEIPIWKDGRFTGRKNGDVQEVWVHPDFRRHGHGKRLMEKVIEKARQEGMENIYLTSRKHREAARHIYVKFGFVNTTDGFTLQLKEKKEVS